MRKIMFIDDDVDFLAAQEIFFSAKGDQVFTATNREDALALLEGTAKPDIIVLDLMMEHYDSGFSLARSISGIKGCESIPMIMVSGVTQATGFRFDEKKALQNWTGLVEFINKPVDPYRIDDTIRRILKG